MAQPTTVYTKRYSQFAGVDFSTDPAKIADSRSPHAVNLISDAGGYPEKRVGWRTLAQVVDTEPCKAVTRSFLKARAATPQDATIAQDGWALNTEASSTVCASATTFQEDGYLQTYFTPGADALATERLALDFELPEEFGAGEFTPVLTGRRNGYKGILADCYLDGVYLGEFDFAAAADSMADKTYAPVTLAPGRHTLLLRRSPDDTHLAVQDSVYTWLCALSLTRTDAHALPVNGVYRAGEAFLVHAGTNLYQWDGASALTRVKDGVRDARSCALPGKAGLFLLTGREYLLFDGETVKEPSEFAYRPIVTRGATNITNQRGGASYQAVNLLTPWRRIQFHIYENDTEHGVYVETNTLRLMTEIDENTQVITRNLATGEVLAPPQEINYATGELTYAKALPISQSGGDNIEVTFSHTVAGNAEKITACSVMANYASRVFFAGNPAEPNCDWYSGLNDPSYAPDVNYTYVGTEDSAILGYARIGEQQAILKSGGAEDASVFLRSTEYNDTQAYFPVKQGIPNEGIVARGSVALLLDDPLFLTASGVQALTSRSIALERIVEMRSSRVNARLTREAGLSDAVACAWNGYYLLFVNGHVYVADSRQKSYLRQSSESFEYEWYYWENVPARVVCAADGTVFFGTADGRLCRLNDDRLDPRGGYAMDAYSDDGAPIVAEWATKLDDDGDFGVLKQLRRRGSGVHIKSYDASNIKLLVRTDHDFGVLLNEARRGVFNFKHTDFKNFTFNTFPNGFIPFDHKVKDYRMIQVICRNDEVNQGFGVYAIERRFVRGYFAK